MRPIPYIITAACNGQPPKQLRLYARNRTQALEAAAELFPGHLLSIPSREPDWFDEPA